jgi:hypothetical protein
MTDRNAIIEKIKALLSKTTANGATEAEMLSALDKASAMMDATRFPMRSCRSPKMKRRCCTPIRRT